MTSAAWREITAASLVRPAAAGIKGIKATGAPRHNAVH